MNHLVLLCNDVLLHFYNNFSRKQSNRKKKTRLSAGFCCIITLLARLIPEGGFVTRRASVSPFLTRRLFDESFYEHPNF